MTSEYKCDLHVHTTASDGGFPPGEIVSRAARAGLSAIAITDHDSTASNRAAAAAGEKLGVRVVPGVELTTAERRHILGYFVSGDSTRLGEYLAGLRAKSWAFMCTILDRLAAQGTVVEPDELAGRTGEGIPNLSHVLDLLYRRGDLPEERADSPEARRVFGDDDYLVNYFREFALQEPFTDTRGAIAMIEEAGGVAVWGHPAHNGHEVNGEELSGLVEMGLRGLEVVTPKHGSREREMLGELCERFGLIPTGGTDYHGRYFPFIEHGREIGFCRVPGRTVERLEQCAPELDPR